MLMTKRSLIATASAAAIMPSFGSTKLKATECNWGVGSWVGRGKVESFADLRKWIGSLKARQLTDFPTGIYAPEQPYQTIYLGAISRPGDEAEHEALVAHGIYNTICRIIESTMLFNGVGNIEDVTIYWHEPLITYVGDRFEFNLGGTRDEVVPGWRAVKAFCRLMVTA
jgi:hypothetical protein